MAVTYRAIERYSARRVPLLPSESAGLKQVHQTICRAASFYFARFKSLLSADLNLIGNARLWLTNLVLVAYVTLVPYYVLSAVLKWTVRWVLTYYYSSREDIRCVTFDDDANRNHKSHTSSWAFSVYLVDSGGTSPAQLLQSIIDCAKDQPALKLVRKAEAFGWIHLWKITEQPGALGMAVQELPPVWKHQLVTEDSVHEYVSEVYQRPDGIETDSQRPPWRVYLIPLALADDADAVFSSSSNCCLLVRCHRLLFNPLDSLIREALDKRWIERDGPASVRVSKSFDTPQRTVVTGSGCVHVSWTHPIPSIDFIDRICLLTGATSAQVVLAAFCQSINQRYRQSAYSAAAILQVEMTAGSSRVYYTLPLGSASLEDGQFVLKTLERQLEMAGEPYRTIPANSCFPLRRTGAAQTNVLSVQMDVVDSSNSLAGISGSFFQWAAFPTPLIPIRLCLWTDESSIRLGLIQHHQLLMPVRADDVERRIHQLAAGLGVQNRRPLSRHSSPSSSPQRLTPPPTPRPSDISR